MECYKYISKSCSIRSEMSLRNYEAQAAALSQEYEARSAALNEAQLRNDAEHVTALFQENIARVAAWEETKRKTNPALNPYDKISPSWVNAPTICVLLQYHLRDYPILPSEDSTTNFKKAFVQILLDRKAILEPLVQKQNTPFLQVAPVNSKVRMNCSNIVDLQKILRENSDILNLVSSWEQQRIKITGEDPYHFVSHDFFETTFLKPIIGPHIHGVLEREKYPLDFYQLNFQKQNKPLLEALEIFFRERMKDPDVKASLVKKWKDDQPAAAQRKKDRDQLFLQQMEEQRIADYYKSFEQLHPYPTVAAEPNVSAANRDGYTQTGGGVSLEKLQKAWIAKKKSFEEEKARHFQNASSHIGNAPPHSGSRFSNSYW